MSGECSTHGICEKWLGTLNETNHSEYLGVDREIILEWILRK